MALGISFLPPSRFQAGLSVFVRTALLASSMSCTISSGSQRDAWLVGNVIVFLAFIRSAIHFSVSGGINRSFAEI